MLRVRYTPMDYNYASLMTQFFGKASFDRLVNMCLGVKDSSRIERGLLNDDENQEGENVNVACFMIHMPYMNQYTNSLYM